METENLASNLKSSQAEHFRLESCFAFRMRDITEFVIDRDLQLEKTVYWEGGTPHMLYNCGGEKIFTVDGRNNCGGDTAQL